MVYLATSYSQKFANDVKKKKKSIIIDFQCPGLLVLYLNFSRTAKSEQHLNIFITGFLNMYLDRKWKYCYD